MPTYIDTVESDVIPAREPVADASAQVDDRWTAQRQHDRRVRRAESIRRRTRSEGFDD